MIKHISTIAELEEEIKNGVVLVDFFATWCGPCRMLSPILEEVAKENPFLTVLKVNVDEATQLAATFGIQSIPTLILFKGGQQIDVKLGYQNKNQLSAFINQ